jgi:hypothetical protein
MFQNWINAERFPVSQLCVNTLPATKVTLNTDGILTFTIINKVIKEQYEVPSHSAAQEIMNFYGTHSSTVKYTTALHYLLSSDK